MNATAKNIIPEEYKDHHYRADHSYVAIKSHERYYDPERKAYGARAVVSRIYAIPFANTEAVMADLAKLKADKHGIYPESKSRKKADQTVSKKNVSGVMSMNGAFLSDYFDPLTNENIPSETYKDYYGDTFLTVRHNNAGKQSDGAKGEPYRVLTDTKTGRTIQIDHRKVEHNISRPANGPHGFSQICFDPKDGSILKAEMVSPNGYAHAQSPDYLKAINQKFAQNMKLSAEEAATFDALRSFIEYRNGLVLRTPQHFRDGANYKNHQGPRKEKNIKRSLK